MVWFAIMMVLFGFQSPSIATQFAKDQAFSKKRQLLYKVVIEGHLLAIKQFIVPRLYYIVQDKSEYMAVFSHMYLRT